MPKFHDYDKDQYESRRVRVRKKRIRNEQNFKNMDPKFFEDEWDDDKFYASFERIRRKRR